MFGFEPIEGHDITCMSNSMFVGECCVTLLACCCDA